MITKQMNELYELAGKVRPQSGWFYDDMDYIFGGEDNAMICEIRGAGFGLPMDDNAKFIAAANPVTVRALIDEIRELSHSLRTMKEGGTNE